MKILLSAYACAPDKGSEPQNGWNWAKYLAERGHKVWCLTRDCNKTSINTYLSKNPINNLQVIFVKLPNALEKMYEFRFAGINVGLYLHYFLWQKESLNIAKLLNEETKFELAQHVTLGSLQQGSGISGLGIPFIFGPAGGGQLAPYKFKKYFGKYWMKQIARKWYGVLLAFYTKKTLSKSHLVLATNRETLNMAKQLGAKRVELFFDCSLPINYFPASIPTRSTQTPLKILWVGRVFAHKGLELVMESLGKLDARVNFHLTIIGDGPVAHKIPLWTKQYNLVGKIEHKGHVPWASIQQIYLEHDIFMFCSLQDSSPAQLLEAMAYALPIVTLNLHGSGFMTPDDAGIKVPAETPQETIKALAAAITDLYDNPDKRLVFGKNAFQFAKTQTWENKISRAEKYYTELLKK